MKNWALALLVLLAILLFNLALKPRAPELPTSEARSNPAFVISADEAKTFVYQNFPAGLKTWQISQNLKNKDAAKFVDFALGNLDDVSGEPDYIAAAYTNGYAADVMVWKNGAGGLTLAAQPNVPGVSGFYPKVKLMDVTHDGRPEVVVSLLVPAGYLETWIFKWTGSQLTVINPTVEENGVAETLLKNAVFIDITGDGALEAVNAPETDKYGVPIYQTFKWDAASYRYVPFKVLKDNYHIGELPLLTQMNEANLLSVFGGAFCPNGATMENSPALPLIFGACGVK